MLKRWAAAAAVLGKEHPRLLPVTLRLLLVGALLGCVVMDWSGGDFYRIGHPTDLVLSSAKLIGALLAIALVVASFRLGSRAL